MYYIVCGKIENEKHFLFNFIFSMISDMNYIPKTDFLMLILSNYAICKNCVILCAMRI